MSIVSGPRPATVDDLELLARVGAAAFFDDPVMSWVFDDARSRPDQLVVLFGGLVRRIFAGGGTLQVLDDACVSYWVPPSSEDDDDGQGEGDDAASPEPLFPADVLERLGILGAAVTAAHPHQPHWYLNVLATLPERRGQGLGERLLQPMLARCDTEGLPAHLQSTNPRNRTLYRRVGFVETGEVALDGGPPMMAMWREPRA